MYANPEGLPGDMWALPFQAGIDMINVIKGDNHEVVKHTGKKVRQPRSG